MRQPWPFGGTKACPIGRESTDFGNLAKRVPESHVLAGIRVGPGYPEIEVLSK